MIGQRPLPKRFKNEIYIANEDYYGSGTYKNPFILIGIISSKPQNLIIDSGTNITQYNNLITFEYDVANGKGITDNSHFWLNRMPNGDKDNFTHTVRGISVSPDKQYIIIEVRGVAGNTPII